MGFRQIFLRLFPWAFDMHPEKSLSYNGFSSVSAPFPVSYGYKRNRYSRSALTLVAGMENPAGTAAKCNPIPVSPTRPGQLTADKASGRGRC